MNKVRLHISELKDIISFLDKFPDTEQITIMTDSSSGIGTLVDVEIDSVIHGMDVKIKYSVSDESTW